MERDFMDAVSKHWEVFENLGNREPRNIIEAQAVIEHIRAEKGYLDQESLQELHTLSSRVQDVLLGIVKAKRETEAAYTTSVSKHLYSSKYRFLYELVQNADDPPYKKIKKAGATPYIRFEVEPSSLIVETNEDGFTRADIEAICATGKSSKKILQSDDHIGEKGFGFKSVFSIADEVHVQSGLWSFCFKYRRGEDGLGMVTPLDAAPEVLPEGVSTRITLQYSDEAKQEYWKLLNAVRDLPETTTMFLHELGTMHINITTPDAQYEKITITKSYNLSRSQCTITRSRECGGKTDSEQCFYLLFSKEKFHLPPHDSRKNRTKAKIELAFPIDPVTLEPKLCDAGYHVFAFLPMQRMPADTDFTTSGGRETVIDSAWNDSICEGVAELFVETVSADFATSSHHLRYSWLDYMPKPHLGSPLTSLLSSIRRSLETRPILETRQGRKFKTPKQCRKLPPCTLHNGVPIFSDLPDEIYLAPEYADRHKELLEDLGVRNIGWDEIIDRLQADLAQPFSRTKTTKADDEWHEAFANLFLPAFSNSALVPKQQRIKKLAIIPLSGPNRWTGAPGVSFGGSDKVYFSHTAGTPIPDSLSLRLLDSTASKNVKRRKFYKAMGVEECPKAVVISKIREAHNDPYPPTDPTGHLRYLFRQQCDISGLKDIIWAPLTDGSIAKLSMYEMYFPSRRNFDMYQLVPKHRKFRYLSPALVDVESTETRVNGESWVEWLARFTDAKYYPPLKSHRLVGGEFVLSEALQAVLARNPSKFLSTLRAHWGEYGPSAHLVDQDLRNCAVPCRSGALIGLHKTYLPTVTVLQEVAAIGVLDTTMPILKLPEATLDEASYRSWKFLEEFGTGPTPDLNFYILAIRAKSQRNEPVVDHVINIYQSMARLATVQDHDLLRETFDRHETPCIWDGDRKRWVTRSQCTFDGPEFISFKTVLMRTYSGNPLLNSFFRTILGISKWNVEDVLQELEMRRENAFSNIDLRLTASIYAFLDTNTKTEEDWQKIKTAFTDEQMILGEHGTWHRLSTCLWQSPFALADFQNLSTIYGSLEGFFVRRLRIKKASVGMLINEVKRMAGEVRPRIDEMRIRLVNIGVFLAKFPLTETTVMALNSLKEVKFLPKKMNAGEGILVGLTDDFAIPDHQRYSDALVDHDVLLHFHLEEVQMLHVLFEQLGLTNRYLSVAVQEVSTVGEGSCEDDALSKQLQAKAYALYCCAAKYKSNKALRGDRALYEQLSQTIICTTKEISTNLVLTRTSGTLSVRSDRSFIHHDSVDGKLRIYVPEETSERRACYRSQLPKLLASILNVGDSATFNIASIISSALQDLNAVLREQDIPPVGWIEKPMVDIPDLVDDERTPDPASAADDSDTATLVSLWSARLTPDATPTRHGRPTYRNYAEESDETTRVSRYAAFIQRVVRSAQRAASRYTGQDAINTGFLQNQEHRYFEPVTTFGSVEAIAWRRIGAAGEAYAFELLSNINIPNFSLENWQSTIRGELSVSEHFFGLRNWIGRETADLVYTDNTGDFTRYLRLNSEGSFPQQISLFRSFTAFPVEYYLEVKSSTQDCGARFYMSTGQYDRMEAMALGPLQQANKVYVILRVFDLMRPDVGLKIFVDPFRFKGTKLDFEVDKWLVTAT